MKMLLKWQMPLKERLKYTIALLFAIIFCILLVVLVILKFNKDISSIIICSIIILVCIFIIMVLNNRKTIIYNDKIVYYNFLGIKKTLKGDVRELYILIHNSKKNKIYLSANYKNDSSKLDARIIYNDLLKEELRRLNIKHDVMLKK